MASLEAADMLIVFFLIQAFLLLSLGCLLLRFVPEFMASHGLKEPNYKGETIPTACGLLVWLLLLTEAAFLRIVDVCWGGRVGFQIYNEHLFANYVSSMSAIAFVGFMDDAIGFKRIKGLRGHWRLWKQERVFSTGLLKAVITVIAAISFVCTQGGIDLMRGGVEVLLLALMTNGFNLLDLRPGRALKVFFTLISTIALASGMGLHHFAKGIEKSFVLEAIPYTLPVLIGAGLLFGPDLRGKLMLGDTGANLLGFGFGCWVILFGVWSLQLLLLLMLVFLHLLASRTSLTRLIERNGLLLWIDRWGRNDMKKT
jgi:UDP-GlcNAc:undecaprenyl-phosphate GlcNAc-1-phosphate transferase